MKDGVVQQIDSPQNLYNNPCNLFVAGFIGSPQMNFFDAKCVVKDGKAVLELGPHTITLPEAQSKALVDGGYDGKVVVMGIRPEDVHDRKMKETDSVVEAPVKVYELLGAEVYLYAELEGANMTARVDPRTAAKAGDVVKFALDVERLHIFDKETEKVITN